jgi:hypothetical protein
VDDFPDDLSGHFWARVEFRDDLGRYVFSIIDYQDNVLLKGVATSVQQASAIVTAWDAVIVSDVGDDPSLGMAKESAGLLDGWAQAERWASPGDG